MEELIKKLGGLDKIAHFGIGGLIFAFVNNAFMFSLPYENTIELSWGFVLLAPIAGYWVTFLVELCKEQFIDPVFDWKDILATMLGCVFAHIGYIVGYVFHFGNGKDLITTWWGWLIFGVIMAVLAVLWIRWVIRDSRKVRKDKK